MSSRAQGRKRVEGLLAEVAGAAQGLARLRRQADAAADYLARLRGEQDGSEERQRSLAFATVQAYALVKRIESEGALALDLYKQAGARLAALHARLEALEPDIAAAMNAAADLILNPRGV